MITDIQKTPEVALVMANSAPIDGWQLYWLISKSQIEYMLTDIAALPPSLEHPELEKAQYQEEVLHVLSLEKHYGLIEEPTKTMQRYIVTKSPTSDQKMVKAILRLSHPVRVRKLNFNALRADQTYLQANANDILGAYTLDDNQLVIIPDIATILENSCYKS